MSFQLLHVISKAAISLKIVGCHCSHQSHLKNSSLDGSPEPFCGSPEFI